MRKIMEDSIKIQKVSNNIYKSLKFCACFYKQRMKAKILI